eukprot:GHRQ01018698.1.p1 GENE.GHRQ01018698.1~~GHRQ01018698.1.p1  ORF type:complete len:206 (+),score=55.50 GHRQ01018698.1:509-1126(+)
MISKWFVEVSWACPAGYAAKQCMLVSGYQHAMTPAVLAVPQLRVVLAYCTAVTAATAATVRCQLCLWVLLLSCWRAQAANHTCGDFDRGVDEFQQSGLTPVASRLVRPPRVRESAVQMECKLRQVIEFKDRDGKPSSAVVLAEVVLFHIADGVAGRSPSGKLVVDPTKLQPVCRLGGVTYGSVTELYDIPRPDKHGAYPAAAAKR